MKIKKLLSVATAAAMAFSMMLGTVSAQEEPLPELQIQEDMDLDGVKASGVTTMAAGRNHTAAVVTNGDLYLWGRNYSGQIGDGTSTDRPSPKKILSSVSTISLNDSGSAAITKDSKLYMWGSCQKIGSTAVGKTPTYMMSGVSSVGLGANHTLVLTTDGKVYAQGYNNNGELGDGTGMTDYNKAHEIMTGAVAVECGANHSAAIKSDGSLYVWGDNAYGQIGTGIVGDVYSPEKILSNVGEVVLFDNSTAAVTRDGHLYLWGNNYSAKPTKFLDSVVSVALGSNFGAAVTTDGSLYTWGGNEKGQLGDGTVTKNVTPHKIMSNVASVSAGMYHAIALTKTGQTYTWGYNGYGQLGNGTTTDSHTPVAVNLGNNSGSGIAKPTGVTATPGNSSITVRWNAVPGAAKYYVYTYINGQYTLKTNTCTATSYTITGLTNGIRYGVLVRAFNSANVGSSFSTADLVYATPSGNATPAKPTGVTATPGNSSITVRWNAVPGATKYYVYTYVNGQYTLKTSSCTATSYTITGLTNGIRYGVLVRAFNSANVGSSFSTADLVYATPSANATPAKPTGVTATPGNASITVKWNAVPGATKYFVYTYVNGQYTLMTSSCTSTSYTITGLINGIRYGVLVRAFNSANVGSSFSTADLVYATPSANATPAKPTGVTATPGNASITVKWNAVPGATKYFVYTYVNGQYTLITSSCTSTSYTITGLINGIRYGVLVRAFNAANVGSSFSTADLVYATPSANTTPAKPTGVTATPGNASITVKWNAVPGAAKYFVYTYVNGQYTLITSSCTSTSYTITGLINGISYGVLVRAFNSANVGSSFSTADLVYATPSANTTPAKPTGVTATPGNASITVKWNAVPGATKYYVYTYVNGQYTLKTSSCTATSYTITGLTNGINYGVLVRAFNAANVGSAFSTADLVYATPSANTGTPAKPTGVTASGSNGAITVSWSAAANAAYYNVYTYINGKYTIQASGITARTYKITGLTNGINYGVLVRAFNAANVGSSFSTADLVYATPSATTVAPSKPTNVKLTAGDKAITVSWSAAANASKYNVYTYLNGSYTLQASNLTTTSYKITGLTNGINYGVLVRAFNASGTGSAFSTADLVYATPGTSASKPTGVTVTPGDSKVTIRWNPVSGAQRYSVSQYDPSTGKYTIMNSYITTTYYEVNYLTNGTRYYFLVQAYVNGAWSSYTTSDLVSAIPNGALSSDTKPRVTATPGNGCIKLSWNGVSGATKYSISEYIPSTGTLRTMSSSYLNTTVTINGLTNGTRYYFVVQAYVGNKWSSYDQSDVVSAMPSAAYPVYSSANVADDDSPIAAEDIAEEAALNIDDVISISVFAPEDEYDGVNHIDEVDEEIVDGYHIKYTAA